MSDRDDLECGPLTPVAASWTKGPLEYSPPSRRERIATAVLAGLVANSDDWSGEGAAAIAVRFADALIAKLDEGE